MVIKTPKRCDERRTTEAAPGRPSFVEDCDRVAATDAATTGQDTIEEVRSSAESPSELQWPYHGLTAEMRVAQLPSVTRVPPQLLSTLYSANVHVWAMNSDANQMFLPSATAAP